MIFYPIPALISAKLANEVETRIDINFYSTVFPYHLMPGCDQREREIRLQVAAGGLFYMKRPIL